VTSTNKTGLEVLERLAADAPDGDMLNLDWNDCFQSWRAYFPKELGPHWALMPREAQLMAVILGDQLVECERHNWH
jgi:hypothetical protein